MVTLPFIADMMGFSGTTALLTRILIYGMAALSLNFILGFGGMVSFGHAAFFGIGGYVVAILYYHYSNDSYFLGFIPGSNQFLVTVPFAMLVSGFAAFIIGALSCRTNGVTFIMITLAFAQMFYFLFVSLSVYGGDDGLMIRRANELFGLNLKDRNVFYFVCLTLSVLFFFVMQRIIQSQFGSVLIGLRQSERRMTALGLPVYRYKLVAFIIAGMGAGLAGALMANFLRFASPDMLHWTKSGELMVMVILGGVATLRGPYLGAALFIALETILTTQTEYWQLFLGFILLFVVLFFNGGIASIAKYLKSYLAGKKS
ncbi:branched-chain amino acid ABC transporter permease [Bartonella sp. HY329]|uniref:branched-chain amino acid ABC transporter permease n=1 Tax=unclassified Bartonella TaxID=2645622 RepID=UPI0021C6632D|nr:MULTISPECIES: branched-chain amino acid ABC transporter permease [unclassified Bartonella]UXM96433.1 branched-chain amino acid ABC transporter permease [Bartonella sp. HY329]UXN10756.1 branched-chain amino acid ABC transporter permease [Bartonella sp. HY328]